MAKRGSHVVLVARREDRLLVLAEELTGEHDVKVEVVPLDLCDPDAAGDLYLRLAEKDISANVLINNAGFGVRGAFIDNHWSREEALIRVNIATLVQLTKLFLPAMAARGYGRIMLVASTAAYQAVPNYAVYGASKAFVLSFGEALGSELKGMGVTCTVVSPGSTATEFHEVAGHTHTPTGRRMRMSSAEVARIGIEAMLKGKPTVVTGLRNSVLVGLGRLLPRRMTTAAAGFVMKKTHSKLPNDDEVKT
jgi:short-subunit dehydrogenase